MAIFMTDEGELPVISRTAILGGRRVAFRQQNCLSLTSGIRRLAKVSVNLPAHYGKQEGILLHHKQRASLHLESSARPFKTSKNTHPAQHTAKNPSVCQREAMITVDTETLGLAGDSIWLAACHIAFTRTG